MMKNQKIAIVHDFSVRFGGAEALVQSWMEMFPAAPLFTLFYDEEKMGKFFSKERVKTSYLQKFYKLTKRYTWLLPFMPKAMESFDLSDFDVILSSSAAFSHGVKITEKQKHVCFVHSPMRWAWDWHFQFMQERKMTGLKKLFFQWILHHIRIWDEETSSRPTVLLAASTEIQKRIQKYWKRESTVVFPFADINRFLPLQNQKERENYFLVVSQLVPYKRIDLAIKACEVLNLPLKIVGDGVMRAELEKIAGKNTEFLGAKYGDDLVKIMQKAKAFLFPGVDDFGMTPVEAMACGVPVVAFQAAGALDTVKEGVSGVFFSEQSVKSLQSLLEKTDFSEFDAEKIRKHAEQFSKEKHLFCIKSYL